jgi:hypothetical protein
VGLVAGDPGRTPAVAGGARAPPPSRSGTGRSQYRGPRSKNTFEAAGLHRRAALYRQPGTTRNRRPPPSGLFQGDPACPRRRASRGLRGVAPDDRLGRLQ